MSEEWRTIEEFPDYEVSSIGNVRSKERIVEKSGDGKGSGSVRYCSVMKTQAVFNGYRGVGLSKDKKLYRRFVHRLVGIAFIPNPDCLPEIDHIDRNRANNDVSNLRWVTRSQNLENRGQESNNALKQRYINYDIRKERYRVRFTRAGIVTIKCFKTLEEALTFRRERLGF